MLTIPPLTVAIIILTAALYGAAAVLLIRYLKGRVAHGSGSVRRPIFIWTRGAIFALACIGLLCLGYGYFIEPYRLEITRVKLTSAKLPAGARPVRFAQISDLHSEAKPRLEERLPAIIAAQKPDFIVFTGDAVNSREGLVTFKRCLSRLAEIAPTFVVKGNWDVWLGDAMDIFGGTGAKELNGEAVKVENGGASVWLAGAACGARGDLSRAIRAIPPGAYGIVLYHHPDMIPDAADSGADLLCAGHTHGGQAALPWYGGLVKIDGPGSPYERGLYRVRETWVYVNRGIGMEGGHSPCLRFLARPEVTVYELAPAFVPQLRGFGG